MLQKEGKKMKLSTNAKTDQNKPVFKITHIRINSIPVPLVSGNLSWKDYAGMVKVRMGIGRDTYTVEPGLYATGAPNLTSPVFITANYKYTFDLLRRDIKGLNAFILVLDTNGINVWCAAGKGTFGTKELIKRIRAAQLAEIVSHKNIILPQLGAVGVSAHTVRKESGFYVKYGPVYSKDIKQYVSSGFEKTRKMRRVHFNFIDRLLVIPVEIKLSLKYIIIALLASAPLSYFTANPVTSFTANTTLVIGSFAAGAVVVPVLLPFIPFKAFSLKGALMGAAAGFAVGYFFNLQTVDFTGTMLLSVAISSYTAMNFTGATTFTNLSGVQKEITFSLPGILIFLLGGISAKIIAIFI
jgi:hypothetical protein